MWQYWSFKITSFFACWLWMSLSNMCFGNLMRQAGYLAAVESKYFVWQEILHNRLVGQKEWVSLQEGLLMTVPFMYVTHNTTCGHIPPRSPDTCTRSQLSYVKADVDARLPA
jgi:hypothetical protein